MFFSCVWVPTWFIATDWGLFVKSPVFSALYLVVTIHLVVLITNVGDSVSTVEWPFCWKSFCICHKARISAFNNFHWRENRNKNLFHFLCSNIGDSIEKENCLVCEKLAAVVETFLSSSFDVSWMKNKDVRAWI